MVQGLLHLHNLMRWIVVLTALYAIIQGMGGMSGGKNFNPGGKRAGLFYMISCDIQLLVGLALYFLGGWGIKNIQNMGMAAAMKDKVSRFFAIEHTLGMLIALILVHIMYASIKKNISDTAKFKKLFWYSLISFIVILASIPWPFRELISRPWFPGMH